jgi:hypothetical protein
MIEPRRISKRTTAEYPTVLKEATNPEEVVVTFNHAENPISAMEKARMPLLVSLSVLVAGSLLIWLIYLWLG